MQALGHSDDDGIHVAERCAGHAPHELRAAAQVFGGGHGDGEVTCAQRHMLKQVGLVESAPAQVVTQESAGLREYRLRYDQLTGPVGQQCDATFVVDVAG